MKNYTAVTNSSGSIDIGQFPSDSEAHAWAVLRYGDDLDSVIGAPVFMAEASALDPWWIVGLIGVLFLFLSDNKKEEKKA